MLDLEAMQAAAAAKPLPLYAGEVPKSAFLDLHQMEAGSLAAVSSNVCPGGALPCQVFQGYFVLKFAPSPMLCKPSATVELHHALCTR